MLSACPFHPLPSQLVALHLLDSSHILDPSRYVSLLLLSLRAMLSLELPHINVLTKVDLLGQASGGELRECSMQRLDNDSIA